MSAALGAALKKIAIAILTDKRALKAIGMTILVLIVALLLPLMAMMAIFTGDIVLDTNALMAQIQQNLSASDIAMLTKIEDTMDAIETALEDKEMPSRVKEAQALYIMALYDHSNQSNFVSKLVGCFRENQSDAQLIARVNQTFGTNIQVEEFTRITVPQERYRADQGSNETHCTGHALSAATRRQIPMCLIFVLARECPKAPLVRGAGKNL